MYAIDVGPAALGRWHRGRAPPARHPSTTSIVASRMAAWASRLASPAPGTALIAASSPTLGSAAISSIARSVAATNAGDRVVLRLERRRRRRSARDPAAA